MDWGFPVGDGLRSNPGPFVFGLIENALLRISKASANENLSGNNLVSAIKLMGFKNLQRYWPCCKISNLHPC